MTPEEILVDLLNEVKSVISTEKIKNQKLDCVSRPEYIDGMERVKRIIEKHLVRA